MESIPIDSERASISKNFLLGNGSLCSLGSVGQLALPIAKLDYGILSTGNLYGLPDEKI